MYVMPCGCFTEERIQICVPTYREILIKHTPRIGSEYNGHGKKLGPKRLVKEEKIFSHMHSPLLLLSFTIFSPFFLFFFFILLHPVNYLKRCAVN